MISTSEQPTKLSNTIALRSAGEAELQKISREGLLSLTLEEMKTIQNHYRTLDRDPSDLELETIAQTWSEHCSHKTFRARYVYSEALLNGEQPLAAGANRTYDNLLKETIVRATTELNMPWCLSVFQDNAGVIAFDDEDAICFKVETHNHPSALEPYGGAGTGLGGVIRDILGCGLGGKPVMNSDVFCFGFLDTKPESLPEGVLSPKRIAKGVISGVRDYGNRMGIPTANGAVYFDRGYTGNPLVFCGTVGLIPKTAISKTVQPGDLVVTAGGRTGRDGIHGATFSSAPLEKGITSSVVQIGHAIMEKKTMDVLLQARDKNLYRSITDCGAGGFSSAIGELGKDTGVDVQLEKAPLKYPGLAPWEIWLSESQERMVMAVPPEKWPELKAMFQEEDVEAVAVGAFTGDKKLTVRYKDQIIGQIEMEFLHDGCPKMALDAAWDSEIHRKRYRGDVPMVVTSTNGTAKDISTTLKSLLAHPVIASKESVVRQYDHEVQGGSVIKPFMGVDQDGPQDACVFRPKLNIWKGVAISNGLNPEMGKWDPYVMAKVAVDEAYRNLLCVGGGLLYAAILDNFCWGDQKNAHDLAALVRASEGAKEAALAYELPFISGKDSFHNTWKDVDGSVHSIPPTLLVSAIAILEDVRSCVSSGFKKAGNSIYVVGETKPELKGSLVYSLWNEQGGDLPSIDLKENKTLYKKLESAMRQKLVQASHDVSEGGIAVAVAEMGFGANIGAELNLPTKPMGAPAFLFSETCGRIIVEVSAENAAAFETIMSGSAFEKIGETIKGSNLVIKQAGAVLAKEPLSKLKTIWKESLGGL